MFSFGERKCGRGSVLWDLEALLGLAMAIIVVGLCGGVMRARAATPQLQASDLTYIGAFALPQSLPTFKPSIFTFDPDGDGGQGSFYISNGYTVVEVTIPTLGCGGYTGSACTTPDSVADLYNNHLATPLVPGTSTATTLTTTLPIDPTGGELAALNSSTANTRSNPIVISSLAYIPAFGSQTSAHLYWSLFEYYDANYFDYPNIGYCDLNLTNPSTIAHLGDQTLPYHRQHAMKTAGTALFLADKTWADTYANGDCLLSGTYRDNGAMASGQGPQLFASAPWNWNWTAGGDIPVKTIMTHFGVQDSDPSAVVDPNSPILAYTTSPPSFSPSDVYGNGVWVKTGSAQAVIFTAIKGTLANECYGNGVIKFGLSSLISSGTTATATINHAGGVAIQTGDTVTISGAKSSAYNGTFTITATSTTTFTYTIPQTAPSPDPSTSITMTDTDLYGRTIPNTGFEYCYDPALSSDEGFHAFPYKTVLNFFSVDDLTAAAQSTASPYTPVSTDQSSTFAPYPYMQFDMTPYIYPVWTGTVQNNQTRLNGIAYDSKSGRLYIMQRAYNASQSTSDPVVLVFQVSSSSQSQTSGIPAPTGVCLRPSQPSQ